MLRLPDQRYRLSGMRFFQTEKRPLLAEGVTGHKIALKGPPVTPIGATNTIATPWQFVAQPCFLSPRSAYIPSGSFSRRTNVFSVVPAIFFAPPGDTLLASSGFAGHLFDHLVALQLCILQMLLPGSLAPGIWLAPAVCYEFFPEQKGIFQLLVFLFPFIGHHILRLAAGIGINIKAGRNPTA